jgi:hypothetical protein
MTSVPEVRYRTLLRVLPADYRAAWEDEMVTTFLQGLMTGDAEQDEYLADYGRPVLAVRLRLPAVRLRLGGTDAPARYRVLGDAVRIVALLGLLVQAATAVVGLAGHLWLAGRVPGLPPGGAATTGRVGLWPTTLILLESAAVPAYLALVTGHWRVARILAALATGAFAVFAVAGLAADGPVPVSLFCAVAIDVLLLAALWAFHDTAPPIRTRPWSIALPAAVGVVGTVALSTGRIGAATWMLDWPALCCLAVTVGLAVQLVASWRDRAAPTLAWSLAVTLLAATVLAQRAATLGNFVSHTPPDQRTVVIVAGVLEALAVAALGLPVAMRVGPALRRLTAAYTGIRKA